MNLARAMLVKLSLSMITNTIQETSMECQAEAAINQMLRDLSARLKNLTNSLISERGPIFIK